MNKVLVIFFVMLAAITTQQSIASNDSDTKKYDNLAHDLMSYNGEEKSGK